MAAAASSFSPRFLALLLLLVGLVAQAQMAWSQPGDCSSQLNSLNVCAPFVVPGASEPGADCCTALQTIDHDCMCNTLRIASRLPSHCNLGPITCGSRNFMGFDGGIRLCVGAELVKLERGDFSPPSPHKKYRWKVIEGGDILWQPGLVFPDVQLSKTSKFYEDNSSANVNV